MTFPVHGDTLASLGPLLLLLCVLLVVIGFVTIRLIQSGMKVRAIALRVSLLAVISLSVVSPLLKPLLNATQFHVPLTTIARIEIVQLPTSPEVSAAAVTIDDPELIREFVAVLNTTTIPRVTRGEGYVSGYLVTIILQKSSTEHQLYISMYKSGALSNKNLFRLIPHIQKESHGIWSRAGEFSSKAAYDWIDKSWSENMSIQ